MIASTLLAAGAAAQNMPAIAPVSSGPGMPSPAAPDIRDIRGPKPVASPWLIPLIALGAVLAIGGAYCAWNWNRQRLRTVSQGPLDVALQRLTKARELMIPTLGREFSIEVSGAVRDYIESRFDVRAAHLTTHEFLHRFLDPTDAVLKAHRDLLDNFLQMCDLAKFGGWKLDVADMEAMLQSASRFVAQSSAAATSTQAPPAASRGATNRPRTTAPRETYVSLPTT